MNSGQLDIEAVAGVLVDQVKLVVLGEVSRVVERIAALEARAPIKGDRGEPGLNGKDGLAGSNGKDGLNGKDGRDGVDGKDGAPGEPGLRGSDGKDGPQGRDGRDGLVGANGKDGLNGKDGNDGINGKDGLPGIHGKDGLDGEHSEIPYAADDIAPLISKAIAYLAESPKIESRAAQPIVLNIDARPSRGQVNKTITTRRDKGGNIVADVVETQ